MNRKGRSPDSTMRWYGGTAILPGDPHQKNIIAGYRMQLSPDADNAIRAFDIRSKKADGRSSEGADQEVTSRTFSMQVSYSVRERYPRNM